MRFFKTLGWFTLLAALALLGLQACQKTEESGGKSNTPVQGKSPETSSADKSPIPIGGIFSITGPASNLGDPEAKSVRMLVDAINARGGIQGRPIELYLEDDQGNETSAVNAANQLIKRTWWPLSVPRAAAPRWPLWICAIRWEFR
jgi:hypothetical protein